MEYWVVKEKWGAKWSISVRNDYLSKKHWNTELELLYMISGSINVTVDDKKYRVSEGELLVICPGSVHSYEEPVNGEKICVCRFMEDCFACFSDGVAEAYRDFYSNVMQVRRDTEISRIMNQVDTIMAVENEVRVESMLMSLFFALSDRLFSVPELIESRYRPQRNNDSETMTKMSEYIHSHLEEKITLGDIANHLGFSESYSSRYIKKKLNMNFLEYLNTERVEAAKIELRRYDVSVTEIAFHTGFSSIQSFNRIFKSFSGVSPSEYRRRAQDKK